MSYITFLDKHGVPQTVTAGTPLPTSGAGGGMDLDAISATAPATWDADNGVIGVDTSGLATAGQGAKADTAVQPGDLAPVATSGAYEDLSGNPTIPTVPVAAHVGDADGTDTTTLAASVDALRDALVAAGLMA